jgi:hypothetical protein
VLINIIKFVCRILTHKGVQNFILTLAGNKVRSVDGGVKFVAQSTGK